MSSICWAGPQGRSVTKENARGAIAPRAILLGLWTVNLTVVTFALPVLLFANLKKAIHRRNPERVVKLSKAAHP